MRMFFILLILSILHISVAFSCELPSERPHKVINKPRNGFDTTLFSETVSDLLDNGYMGYSVTLRGKAGKIIAQINHGYARTPCENGGAQKFNGATQAPIGSVSKALTAATVIHRAEKLGKVDLNHPFRSYLPKRWRNELHASLHPVTLKHLLQHKGGFAKSAKTLWNHKYSYQERLRLGAESYIVAAQNIAKNENKKIPEPITTRSYSNTSFALWNASTASLTPKKWANVEAGYDGTEITYDSYIRPHAYRLYKDMVQKVLFDPINVTGGCNTYTESDNYAMNYNSPDGEYGKNHSEPGRPCAIGGWFLSSRALSKAVHHIVSTRKVVNQHHEEMFLNNNNRLVFASRSNLPDGSAFSHNGSRFNGTAKAEVIVFPNGMVAAAIANSNKKGDSSGLLSAVLEGYKAALP